MSDYLNPALAELKAAIIAAWPQLLKNDGGKRLYEHEHVAAAPFDEIVGTHGLPFAVLFAGDEKPAGIDAEDSYGMVDVEVLYVYEASGKASVGRTRGQALRDYLWPDDPLTLSQVMNRPSVSVSLKSASNAYLRLKKLPVQSVSVTFQLLTGEPVEV